MKTFKKVLASALAAAMVVTAFPVTNAEAATKAKLSTKKATIYVGQSKTIKVTLPKGAKITSVKTSKKAVATVKKSGKKVVVKAVKAGKATVTVKVTPKKGKATNLKATITVKNEAIRVSGDSVVAVGATTTLKTATAPKNATVTFKSSDDTIATVDEKGVVTGVKAGKVTITATAGKASKDVEIEVKNYVLKAVKQTKANEFEATIIGATKNIKPADVTMKNTTTNVVVPVKALAVDSKDATKVTLTTFANVTDGKTYEVTLDGTTQTVTATEGKVASVGVNKVTIPYATETEIKLVSKDANGVIIDEIAYGTQDSSKFDFTLSTSNGYVNGSKLYLNKVGDTATAEVTYKTGKYDANGKPEGNITSGKVAITAVDQAAVNSYDVKIAKTGKSFDKVAANKQIAVGETSANTAYFQIKDADNKEIPFYTDYTVESSDNSILMVNDASIADKEATLTPVKAGTAYLLIKKNNVIVGSVAITVVAEKAVTTMAVDKASVALSTKLGVNGDVIVSFKDQYSAEIAGDAKNVAVTCLSTSADKVKAADVTANASKTYFDTAQTGNNVKVTFKAAVTKGSYVYKIAYMKDGKEVCAKTVNVNVQTPVDAGKGSVSYALNMNTTKIDTLVDDKHHTANDYKVTVDVTELIAGVPNATLKNGSKISDNADEAKRTVVKSIVYKVVDPNGKAIYDNVTKENAVTSTAISVDENEKLTIETVTFNDAKAAKKNLTKGTYTVTAVIKTLAAGKEDKDAVKSTFTTSFVVDDTQPTGELSVVKNTVGNDTIETMAENAFKYVYEGTTYSAEAGAEHLKVTGIEGITSNNKKIDSNNFDKEPLAAGEKVSISKVTVQVVPGDEKYTVDITVPVSVTLIAE